MLLEMELITKKYGAFTANDKVNFSLKKGEVHAIVGENGAGKTTLMKILYGMEQPTTGSIRINGKNVHFHSPADAIAHGIGMVHQHFMLFSSFTVAENIVLGHEPAHGPVFNRNEAVKQVEELSRTYGLPIDPLKKIVECTVGMQQRVEILKVLYHGAEIIILDEPTAVLTPMEVKELLATIRNLAKQGKSFILITHKLQEVMDVADRITVLRSGQVTGSVDKKDTNVEELSRLMVGRDLVGIKRAARTEGKVILETKDLVIQGKQGRPLVDHVSLQVCAGEIVGIAGVSGNGQTELIEALTGMRHMDSGSITLLGKEISNASVQQIRQAGLAHIPEDRYLLGAAKEATVKENSFMGYQYKKDFHRYGILNHKRVAEMAKRFVQLFSVKTGSIDEKAGNLSGGNLQKLIVAREIGQETPFLIAAEPTRGVDIGAMEFIHQKIMEKRNQGDGVLLVSSELSEILALSDRILVMFDGKIAGELHAQDATEEEISLLMAGGEKREQLEAI